MGLITTAGYRYVLEIARQSVPEGYGNSYFWVKPDRIVPVDRVEEVEGRLDVTGGEVRPLDEAQVAEVARRYRDRGIDTLGVCLLHSYANPTSTSGACSTSSVASTPTPSCRSAPRCCASTASTSAPSPRWSTRRSSPASGATSAAIAERLAAYTDADVPGDASGGEEDAAVEVPFYIMKSNGGVISSDEVVHQPITTVLSGPAAGALGAALVAAEAGYDRILTCDGGGTSTDVSVVLGANRPSRPRARSGAIPSKIPMIDIVTVGAGGGSIAWISPEGQPQGRSPVGGGRPRPALLRQGRHRTDRHRRARPPRPHPAPPARWRDRAGPRGRDRRHRTARRGPRPRTSTTPRAASSRSRPGTRRTPSARSPSSAGSTSASSPWPPSADPGRCWSAG
jgi:N-methylhydantoinase A